MSLFDVSIISSTELFLMVIGSRLGSAAIVLFVGAMDYFQKHRYSLGHATELGLLTFIVTHSIYLPATVLGYLVLPSLEHSVGGLIVGSVTGFQLLVVFQPITRAVVSSLGVWPGLAIAVGVLFASLTLFDRTLGRVNTTWLREGLFGRFRNRWVAFGIGLLVTAVTTSVAFSLGVIVPLYNRGYVKRREIVPYILGANIGTFADTLAVAILLESPVALLVIMTVLGAGSLLITGFLVWYPAYYRPVANVQNHLETDRRVLGAFLLALLLVPVLLVVLPM
ncbi:sodium:phosphate symporter [Halodesulfurarchaeum sp. HSR-GB]|uniref:sodium:phosphate symporter n=1 Tax=Halodesulfurarchaeum sp. HSR-GB TaxID=3074077 RepID=UPI00285BBF35|nr:sodium:phosphate symporter [Halodesulfurarchaeum sp. HSR-GB]MDR5657112.1 sodium:phosphate symporter [Halodesulfurarchaeum sp. HSR-GB]